MATKSTTSTAPAEDPKTTAVAAAGPGTAVASSESDVLDLTLLADDLGEDEGAGLSSSVDDNIIPFVTILQDMSPEVKQRDPLYVPGAQPGFILNKASRRAYGPKDHQKGWQLDESVIVQPCAFDRALVQWTPRDAGGGYRGRFPLQGTVADSMRALGAKEIPDPRDSSGRKMMWRLDNGDDLIDTRYHFVNIIDLEEGTFSPAVIGLSSTGHTPSRQWMTTMNDARRKRSNGTLAKMPSWARLYRMTTIAKSNSQGEWFVPSFSVLTLPEDAPQHPLVEHNGWLRSASIYSAGKVFHDSVSSGAVTAAAESDDASPEADGNIPF